MRRIMLGGCAALLLGASACGDDAPEGNQTPATDIVPSPTGDVGIVRDSDVDVNTPQQTVAGPSNVGGTVPGFDPPVAGP